MKKLSRLLLLGVLFLILLNTACNLSVQRTPPPLGAIFPNDLSSVPTSTWGVMISDGRNYIVTHPWLSLFPGLAILLAVAAFNLIGDGLRDALDSRLRGTD